jgi:hypothetical protein
MNAPRLYGLMAEFTQPEPLLEAARRASDAGYSRVEAYSPFEVEGLAHSLRLPPSRVPLFTLLGGILGGGGAYFMLWYSSVVDLPWNVGGRPTNSWTSFIPITFELTVLGASFGAVLSMLILNRLIRIHHPVFQVPAFLRASRDRFFLCLRAEDPAFERAGTRAFLEGLGPVAVHEVPQ